METTPKKIALLVHSCDRYEFLYKGFAAFFSRYWDFSIPCAYYFATEEKKAMVPGFQTVQSGRGEWADRLAFLLKEKIREDYVLYFQEDMWLTKPVNPVFFTQLFEQAIANHWKQVKLHSASIYKTGPTPLFIEGFNVARLDNAASDFLMSHQVTLWNKHFLLPQLHKGEHPWRNERRGSKRLKSLNPEIYHIDYFADGGQPEINANRHPIGRSEYHSISVNGMLNDNVQPFINLLKLGRPEEQAYAAELQHHYDNKLTHDGKPKPRKDDLFKKLKRLLKS